MTEVCVVTGMCVVVQCVMTEVCVVFQTPRCSDRVRWRVSRHDGYSGVFKALASTGLLDCATYACGYVRIVLVRLTSLSVSHCADAAQGWR